MFDKIAIIGLGLIGSSLSHVVRREKLAGHIAGYARSEATRAKAVELGLVHSMHESAAAAVAEVFGLELEETPTPPQIARLAAR